MNILLIIQIKLILFYNEIKNTLKYKIFGKKTPLEQIQESDPHTYGDD